MQLTVREAAAYLSVGEATVRRWIARRGLPVHRVNERLHLNAIELWEWATENGIPVSRGLLQQAQRHPEEVPPLSELLAVGGIHHDVGGRDKPSVLREIVQRLPLPAEIDREFLATTLEAREAMGSTGIGDGIAIPHVRNPILLHIAAPFVTLCLLRHAVDFDAIDGKPVHALFTVISANVPGHLRILGQLGFALHDEELRRLLTRRAPAAEILARVRAVEGHAGGGGGGARAPGRKP
jgi:PTS system nitrogen regulatory IIA component